MRIRVGINKLETLEEDKLNKGEYNIHECEFEFDDVYTDLIKKAVFSKDDHNYLVDIENDSVIVPYEMFENNNDFSIGVYGYEVDGTELVLRYSPTPVYMQVSEGSYKDNYDNYKVPTAEVVEQIEEEIQSVKGVILYNNDEGATANFDISEDVKNYDYIEIFYQSQHGHLTSKKMLVNQYGVMGYLDVVLTDGEDMMIYGTTIFISSTRAVFKGATATRVEFSDTEPYVNYSTNVIKLNRIIGYKS